MPRYALIDNDGTVVNVIELADGALDATIEVPALDDDGRPVVEVVDGEERPVVDVVPWYTPPDGVELVEVDGELDATPGGTYVDGTFHRPPPAPPRVDPLAELVDALVTKGVLTADEAANVQPGRPAAPAGPSAAGSGR